MTNRRPRVLLAIEPPLLADLLRRALEADDMVVDITSTSGRALGPWDVAVTSGSHPPPVEARHVIDLRPFDHAEFASLVAVVRSLVGR